MSVIDTVRLEDGSGDMRGDAAILYEKIFDDDPEREMYYNLLDEVQSNLTVGTVEVFGTHRERRMTCSYSTTGMSFTYSGRKVEPHTPQEGGLIGILFECINHDEIKELFREISNVELPEFNTVFINWYRPPDHESRANETKPDGLGWHADDERSHRSQIILSMTFCEKNGERFFEMRPKHLKSGCSWKYELPHQSVLLMLPGCQNAYKHRVSDRVTNSERKKITGGRLNLTFRALSPLE